MDEFQKIHHIGDEMEKDLMWGRDRPRKMYIQCGWCGEIITYRYDRLTTPEIEKKRAAEIDSKMNVTIDLETGVVSSKKNEVDNAFTVA